MKSLSMILQLMVLLTVAACSNAPEKRTDGYAQVTGPCNLSFPGDHGPHPGYRTEWWYYTGNLTDAHQRRFGFQLTFFRRRLKPPADRKDWPDPASPWRTDQVYLAHAALTDIAGRRHLQAEKMARPVLSLAGAEQENGAWKIYLENWQAVIAPDGHHLRADADGYALTLALKPDKPLVLHGDAGYSRKGQTPERASCYYSFTRLRADGTLTLDGTPHRVQGTAWMDHEFSTAALQPGITGWDWFSLQLSDRTEIMIFLLRQRDGSLNPASSGTYVTPSGQAQHLRREDVHIEALDFWTSPHTGARYPVTWKIEVAPFNDEFIVTAGLADQEMRTARSTGVVYWEGSVRVKGTARGKPVEGVGYVELTGYDKPFDAPM
jgi:predicted secreted hydrolase